MKTKTLRKLLSQLLAAAAMTAGVGGTAVALDNVEAGKGSACAGIRSDASFLNSKDHYIEQVKPLKRTRRIGKVPLQQTVGVQVTVRPDEGLTKHYLHRVVSCQVPRELSEVASGDVPEVKASVREWNDRLVVDIEAKNAHEGKEVKELIERALERRPTAQL